jgi:Domain of unknown function (DUF222)
MIVSGADAMAAIGRLCGLDVPSLGSGGVAVALADSARVRAWLDAFDVACARRLGELTPLVEQQAAGVTRAGRRATGALIRRANTIDAAPALEPALAGGRISAGHVDVFGNALNKLNTEQQQQLASRAAELVAVAAEATPEQFGRTLLLEVAKLDDSNGVDRFERQRRDTSLRMWVDNHSGMYRLAGQFDPEKGAVLEGRLDNAIEVLFHGKVPDTCPDADGKQDHLRALALFQLTADRAAATDDIVTVGRNIDLCVAVDLDTLVSGLHEHSLLDLGSDAELPVATIRRMACTAGIVPFVLNGDGVVLDEGRKKRLATRAQRLALRVMYKTCGIEDCPVSSKHCEPHHLDGWSAQHGETNLEKLLPLCCGHHHAVHEGGWQIVMHADRSLTVTLPDGTVFECGPPRRQRNRSP